MLRKKKSDDPMDRIMDPDGPQLTAEQRDALRMAQASLRSGLRNMYDEFSTEAGWRLRLKVPGKFKIQPVMLIVYCLVMLADSALSFGQRIVDLEEEGDVLVLSSLTTRQYFWLLFAIRVVLTLPVMMLAGYGESYNLVLRRYVELHAAYVKVCKRLGEEPAEDWPHQNLKEVAAKEMLQGTICMVTTVFVNAMAESVLDCVLNLMAIHFLTSLDEWAENNVALNAYSELDRFFKGIKQALSNPSYDAATKKKIEEAPSKHAVEQFLLFWSVEKVEAR